MPRWLERRGFSLRRPAVAQADAETDAAAERAESGGFVRVSLMERVGLVRGFYNVREARAEHAGDGNSASDDVRIVGAGRALSWRWLRESEASRLLDERLGTLEAMGYTLIDSGMAARGRWDWLYDLVNRQLAGSTEDSTGERPAPTALRDALTRLGLKPDAVIDGVSEVLGVPREALLDPSPEVVRGTDPKQLAVLLPFLIHHDSFEIRSIGERWLRSPTVAYQVPRHVLVQWLESDSTAAQLLGPRLDAEGLALLGPDALARLTRSGLDQVRDAALRWARRIR